MTPRPGVGGTVSGMNRGARTAALLIAAGLALTACGNNQQSTSAPSTSAGPASGTASSGSPACASADALRQSVAHLKDVDVRSSGDIPALQSALGQVRTDVGQLAQTAKGQFTAQVDQVQANIAAVRTALDAAVASPANRTPGAVTSSVDTLVHDADALADKVRQGC
jgi:hypothetical protein